MNHTTGKLHITDSGDPHWMREGRTKDNRGIFWCGSFPTELAHADARRLVACWNVCQHLTTEQLEAGDLDYAGCSTLADIRIALGVGEKPMLSELAGIVRTRMGVIKILERDAKDYAAEVERLTAERDAAVRERDAAVEALRKIDTMREMFPDDVLIVGLCDKARAALAKIEGGRV